MITKNEIPILEYDDFSIEVIRPNHGRENLKLPEKCIFAFLGDCVDEFATNINAEVAEKFENCSRVTNIYVVEYKGQKICLVRPNIGAPAAVQLLDMLIACGCKKIIATGSCGVLKDIRENAFLIPTKALRDEGTSFHYLPPSRYIEINQNMIDKIKSGFEKLEVPFEECITWTTDGFFRETKETVQYRLSEGCATVEMECAALAACAQKREALFGQFFFTADSLANVNEHNVRNFGVSSHSIALQLALDLISNI
ncbi:MAG: nucleoside phosphorylase [Solobacterium sp.]|nr:nucleoside phosphorylase [Solobacterium sp.]